MRSTNRATTIPNSAAAQEPLYSAQLSRNVNGCSNSHSVRHFGSVVLRDDVGTTFSAEIWQECPGAATARVTVYACDTMPRLYFFRLRIGDRAEVATLLKELAERIDALPSSSQLEPAEQCVAGPSRDDERKSALDTNQGAEPEAASQLWKRPQ